METLISQLKQGDKQAFSALIQLILVDLYRVSRSILHRECDCSDAIQETIIQAYLHIHQLQNVDRFKSWIFRILVNQCYKIINQQKKTVSLDTYSKEIEYEKNDYEHIEIREMLDHIEEDQRIVLALFYFERCSIAEISDILCIPEGTVKSRMYRGKRALEWMLNSDRKRVMENE
ncbi:sigma-70 family RNA polymerase sigma factor [Hazenella sp. IB182357]|uniref:Sigma-70 family RNA polymerase sigma factor n=1 Tax=Polycladospora coralii TaxID=2771432 RepID=A0A926N992_9BACL|nr:sigma-70 family RNA polymerase sigma factor [Polycladospora coralii]MBD1371727.1 sigma-70 family RNA polymerase sigma factor [Polycladospora coralii]MBS7529194.1 sigma-70 family RNA polymerase sigma factor [Polycladospora coralii]